ncbi:hypothetical protein PPL_10605 [Heterostelium album PN500]|uniref:F-box/LRR-repeat protein 15-like leucin rich repeat domain-containing protein n=1 Tax=Heterostelium pallidum (strain ATCC 26659 / Pp 5 / PN500) TaxID=670386 RepID=D3BRJ4_HETP5|nr:hypothetical protein PPL_10605 [Heterostelium album PN500]EFA76026.1 hypothetical protein PPL_10605 [Heterostelium album PN500]|eukprot:XP_020428160.1 hypothetical protein PPL_10605 [Heterostelium album PN500]
MINNNSADRISSLKQHCFNFLLRHRENIPKNVNTIYEIPEIREQFVTLAKRKNLVDDQFFSVFGDVFILTGANSNTTTPFLLNPQFHTASATQQQQQQQHNITYQNTSNNNNNDGDVEMTPPSNDYPIISSNSNNINQSNVNINNSIYEIDLTGLGRITDISIQFITKYNNLQHLNLSFCTGISNDFIKILAANEMIQLQSLNLYYTNTNDQSIQSIVNAYPNLKSLSIAGCQSVTEAGIKSLAKCSSLTYLDISHIRKLSSSITKQLAFPQLIYLNASWLGPDSKEVSFSKQSVWCLSTSRTVRHPLLRSTPSV